MLPNDLENANELAKLIFDLVQDEGSAVKIVYPNADFGGPNSTIFVEHNFGPSEQYFGDSVIDCLKQAKAAKE